LTYEIYEIRSAFQGVAELSPAQFKDEDPNPSDHLVGLNTFGRDAVPEEVGLFLF
jgi:hypothetical protein